tara:strand:+ start:1506 stop:1685 length:180 start_codon:yes stop_codon:yes gene_type:complete
LTIEFNEDTEEVEYIQEEIIEPSDMEGSQVINELVEEEYWNNESIEILKKFYTGEIGES